MTDTIGYWGRRFVAAFLLVLGAEATGLAGHIDAGEGGPLEGFQFLLLLAMTLLWILDFRLLARDPGEASIGLRAVCFCALAIVITAIGRETNWGRVPGFAPVVVSWLKIVNAAILVALIAGALRLFRQVGDKRGFLRGLVASRFFGWMVFSLVILAVANFTEHHMHGLPHESFDEEAFELLAYLSVARAALLLHSAAPHLSAFTEKHS